MKWAIGILAALGAALCGCNNPQAQAQQMKRQHEQAVLRGKQVFAAELAQHNLAWYVYGDQPFTGFDRKSGLPEQMVSSGAVDPLDSVFAQSHNDQITQYMQRNGPPPGSFKQWEPQLFGQAGYFAREGRAQAPGRLAIGAQPLKSPDGQYTLILQWSGASAALITRPGPQILVFSSQGEHETSAPSGASDAGADVIFGPPGSQLAFTRWTASGKPLYAALDLRNARWLVIQQGS